MRKIDFVPEVVHPDVYEVTYTLKITSLVQADERYDAIQMAIRGYGEVMDKRTTLKRVKKIKK